jgi:hypothetical protein
MPFHPPGRVPLFLLAPLVRGGRPPARAWVVSADRAVPVAARLCRGPGRAPGPLGGRPPLRCAAVLFAAVCPICLVAAWQVTRAAAMAAAAFVAARNWVMSPASAATFVAAAAATRAAAAASAAAALAAAAVPRSLPVSSPLRSSTAIGGGTVAGPVATDSGRDIEEGCVASSVECWGGICGWYWSWWAMNMIIRGVFLTVFRRGAERPVGGADGSTETGSRPPWGYTRRLQSFGPTAQRVRKRHRLETGRGGLERDRTQRASAREN